MFDDHEIIDKLTALYKKEEPILVRNAIRTPDGTILESVSRYDYKTYVDSLTNKTYMIDGGLDYIRRSNNGDEESLAVYSDEPHEVLRDVITWGTYGKEGDEPLKYVTISEMSSEHINAVLSNCNPMPYIRDCMGQELKYRESI